MRKNVLFLVHGVGKQSTGWSKPAQKVLSDEYRRYMAHTGKSVKLSDDLKFVEITYNEIFHAVLRRWAGLARSLEPAADIPSPVQKVTSILGSAAGGGSQLANNREVDFAGDVILYYGFNLIRRLVLLKVMSIIAKTVADSRQQDLRTEFGILGHSLGTAVAHDALHVLGTTDWSGGKWNSSAIATLDAAEAAFSKKTGSMTDEQKTTLSSIKRRVGPAAFSPGRMQFSGIFMVSNVTRVVARVKDPLRSIVRPVPIVPSGSLGGNTDFYYNIAHDLDPICKVKEFDAAKLDDGTGSALNISVAHLYDKNIHALDHYLKNPKAHRFIFLRMCRNFGDRESEYADRRFSEELKAQAHADFFPRRGGNFSDATIQADVKDRLVKHLLGALKGFA